MNLNHLGTERNKAYNPGESLKLDLQEKLKFICLDGNEFPYSPSTKVLDTLAEVIKGGFINKYPDTTNRYLRKKVSEYVGVPEDYIIITNGADSAIKYICNAFYKRHVPLPLSDSCLVKQEKVTYHFFSSYAKSIGFHILYANKDIFSTSLKDFYDKRNTLNYIVNPSNPGGVLYKRSEILELVKSKRDSFFLIDEAYTEFEKESVTKYVPQFNNLIVIRSFSKSFGLAGMRIGFIVIDPEFSRKNIWPYKDNKEVSLLSQIAAITSLDDLDYMTNRVNKIKHDKKNLSKALSELGLDVINTSSNFVLIKDDRVVDLYKHLFKNNILTRIFDNWKGFMRISIGTTEEIDELLNVIGGFK